MLQMVTCNHMRLTLKAESGYTVTTAATGGYFIDRRLAARDGHKVASPLPREQTTLDGGIDSIMSAAL